MTVANASFNFKYFHNLLFNNILLRKKRKFQKFGMEVFVMLCIGKGTQNNKPPWMNINTYVDRQDIYVY